MDSDLSQPLVVRPTPGGAAGDGSMNGALTVQANATAGFSGTYLAVRSGNYPVFVGDGYGGLIQRCSFNGGGNWQLRNESGFIALAVGSGGYVYQFANEATAGLGFSPIYSAGLRVALGTASTPIASFAPAATGSFTIRWRLAAKAATTPTLTLTYTDPDAGAQTITLYSSAMLANGVASGTYPFVSGASAIAVSGSALVANDIIATVEIIQSQ